MALHRVFIQVLVALSMSIGLSMGIVEVIEYFPEVSSDLSNVTWAHAVNSHAKLKDALSGPAMMLEADILMGTLHGSSEIIPIMAHPPHLTSDLSFAQFLAAILTATNTNGLRKGIKLDFKQIEAVEPVLRALEHYEESSDLNIPVWLNADILKGPVKSEKVPVNAKDFLNLTKTYLETATLSLGWTTRYGRDDIRADETNLQLKTIKKGEYLGSHIDEMLDLYNQLHLSSPVTFPVRAGLAVESSNQLLRLLTLTDSSATITLWSAEDDPIKMKSLHSLFLKIGRDRIYVDLPFDLSTGPEIIPDPVFERVRNAEYSNSSGTKVLSTTSTLVSFLVLATYLFL